MTALADNLATALANGIQHPGNQEQQQLPVLLKLPGFTGTAMPPPMKDHVTAGTQMIAEAIIAFIETTHIITPKADQ